MKLQSERNSYHFVVFLMWFSLPHRHSSFLMLAYSLFTTADSGTKQAQRTKINERNCFNFLCAPRLVMHFRKVLKIIVISFIVLISFFGGVWLWRTRNQIIKKKEAKWTASWRHEKHKRRQWRSPWRLNELTENGVRICSFSIFTTEVKIYLSFAWLGEGSTERKDEKDKRFVHFGRWCDNRTIHTQKLFSPPNGVANTIQLWN